MALHRMAGSDTLNVGFSTIPGVPIGPPGGYVNRPGFSHGGAGVAAAGTAGHAPSAARCSAPRETRHRPGRARAPGAVDLALGTARDALRKAAHEIDADTGDRHGGGALRARRVRTLTEAVATDVLARTGGRWAPDRQPRRSGLRAVDVTPFTLRRSIMPSVTWRCLASQ